MAGDGPRRILGVDPGSQATGYGVIEVEGSRAALVCEGALRPPPARALHLRLLAIRDGLRRVVQEHGVSSIAVETLFTGRNPRSAHVLAQARGVILLLAAEEGLELHEYTPMQIKQAATGYGRADKDQVRRMVGVLLSLPGPPSSRDAADALAAALCLASRGSGPLAELRAGRGAGVRR